MPPRPVPLAYAGRKLTGPPEGYDKKKELQVKKWLTNIPQDNVSDLAASVATISELGGPLEPTLDDLYDDLRDSTDGDFHSARRKQGAVPERPPKQAPKPVVPAGAPGAPTPPAPTAPPKPPPLGVTAQYTGLSITTPVAPGTAAVLPAGTAAPASPSLQPPASPLSTISSGTPQPSPSPTPSPGPGTKRPASPAAGPSGSAVGSAQTPSRPSPTKVPIQDVAPLEFVLGGVGDPLRGALGGAADSEADKQGVAVTAGLLVARAEAAAAAQGQPLGDAEKYKAALLLAVREKQRLAEEVRGELAASRAAAAAAQQDAARHATGAAADATAAAQRAVNAEADLAKARAELLRVQQDAKMKVMDLEDKEDEYRAQVARLQAEVASAVARLQAQGDSREQALKSAHEEALAAREAAAGLDRQYKHLRRQYELDKTRLEMEVLALRDALRASEADKARLENEKQSALDGWQAEAAARIAAEESEKRALKAATKQAEVADALAQARQFNAAMKQQATLATQRSAAARDPATALAEPHVSGTPVKATSAVLASQVAGARAGSARRSGSPQRGGINANNGNVRASLKGPAAAGAAAAGQKQADGLNPTGRQQALMQDYDEAELSRLEAHRGLARAMAADKQALADVVRAQKRAVLAAQLADSKVVEGALAAAPDHLKALGLAFRAFVVGAPAAPAAAPSTSSSAAAPVAPASGPAAAWSAALARELVVSLGAAGFRAVLDPVLASPQPPPIPSLPGLEVPVTCPLVGISSALVLVAAPGLLASPAHAAAVNEAGARGVPLIVVAQDVMQLGELMQGGSTAGSSTVGSTVGGTVGGTVSSTGAKPKGAAAAGSPTKEASNLAAQPLSTKGLEWLTAAWDGRIKVSSGNGGGRGATASSNSTTAAAATQTVCQRLGIPDPQLRSLPMDSLKRMSVEKGLAIPDLVHLNCPRLTHLKVTLLPDGATAAGATAGGATASGASQPPAATSGGQARDGSVAGMELQVLLGILKGNVTLTTLTLKGPSVSQARAVAQAVASTPTCNVRSVCVGAEVPVGGLLGKPGVPPLEALDFSQAGAALGPEDVAVMEVSIGSEGAVARGALKSLSLPPVLSPAFDAPQAQEAAQRLASAITGLSSLTRLNGTPLPTPTSVAAAGGLLDLSGSPLGPIAGAALLAAAQAAKALGPALAALNLTGAQLAPGGAVAFARCVSGSGGLGGLQLACLADNRLGAEGTAHMCGAILGSAGTGATQGHGSSASVRPAALSSVATPPPLAVLDLSLNGLGDEGAKVLGKCLKEVALPTLKCLNLGSNGIQADGARALAPSLSRLTGMRDLQLPGNFLGDAGVAALAAAAAGLPGLRVLGLQENYNVGIEGARALGALLAGSSSLQELSLAKNHVGVEGARQLGLGLASNTSLTSLDLQWCKLRTEGVAHIATALAQNKGLVHLNLARNGAGDRGVKGLVEALSTNTTLQRLDLRSNNIGLVGCRLLGTMLREGHNTSLTELGMGGNEEQPRVLEALEEAAATPRLPTQQRRRALAYPPGPGGPTVPPPRPSSAAPVPTATAAAASIVAAGQAAVTAAPTRPVTAGASTAAGPVSGAAVPAGTIDTARQSRDGARSVNPSSRADSDWRQYASQQQQAGTTHPGSGPSRASAHASYAGSAAGTSYTSYATGMEHQGPGGSMTGHQSQRAVSPDASLYRGAASSTGATAGGGPPSRPVTAEQYTVSQQGKSEEEEDLEALLARYRSGVPSGSGGSEGAGGFMNYGYTGM